MLFKKILTKVLVFGFAVAFVSIAISLVMGEFIVKHMIPQETYGLARSVGLNIFDASPTLPYTLQKDVSRFLHIAFTREFTHFISTNSKRTRGKEFSQDKPVDTYRILFLGDSITLGWGVEDDQAYPSFVETYLTKLLKSESPYKRVEIINAGFTDGNAPDTFYLYYSEIGAAYNPDLVIVNFHPVNDIYDMYYHNWDKVDEVGNPLKISSKTHDVKAGYLISKKKTKWKFEMPILRNSHLGMMFMNALERGAPQIVEKIKPLLGVVEDTQEFTMDQNYECLYALQQDKCPQVLWPYIETSKQMFKSLKQATDKNGDELLLTFMPGPHQVKPLSEKEDRMEQLESIQPQKYYREFMLQEKIGYLDLTSALVRQKDASGLFYGLDGHINQHGHALVAKEIVTYLQNLKPKLFSAQ